MSEINYTEEIPEGNFLFNLKLMQRHQLVEPSLMAKYKNGTYHKGYFLVGSNVYLILITWKDKIVIP